jgi:coniferyl-aldehyde dehydrogenase
MNTGNLDTRLAAQRAAFRREAPPGLIARRADLLALRNALRARREQFAAAVTADFGHRSPYETALMEILTVVQGIDYQRHHLRQWMRSERRRVAMHFFPGRARIIYQPLGVIGILSPWNYPISLALMPLATAIAAGNRAMLKPSELTPATSALLGDMLRELFPEEKVTVVIGGADVGAAFAALPFDHIVFTGSTGVGRRVMRAASDHLVPVTLELGGKSPAIVEPKPALEQAASSIAYGKLINAGQTCIAPDYALVHEGDTAAFVTAYTNAVRKLFPGGSADPAYASIINARHYDRLRGLLDDARTHGARIIEIEAAGRNGPREDRRLPPTVVLDTAPEMALSKEEIFGPILPIVPYRNVSDAIDYVNARPRPLALYVFTRDRPFRDLVLERTTSGNVTVNDTLLHFAQDDLPFGGVGDSGMGAYHGKEGFLTLSHAKGVFDQARWNAGRLVRPPYGRITDALLRYLVR